MLGLIKTISISRLCQGSHERRGMVRGYELSSSSIQYCGPDVGFQAAFPSATKVFFNIAITRSRRPWTTSNPVVLPYHAAAECLSFRLFRSRDTSLKGTSLASKIFTGTV